MTEKIKDTWIVWEEERLTEKINKLGLKYSVVRTTQNPTGRKRQQQIFLQKNGHTGTHEIVPYHQDSWNTYLTLKFCNEILARIEHKRTYNNVST